MADHTNLEALISDTLVEMRRLGYSENTITGFRRMFAALSRYAVSQGRKESGEELAIRFPDAKFGVELTQPCQANPGGSYLKAWLRAMRVLLEMGECGRVCKRMPGDLVRTELPGELQSLPDSSDDASRRAGHPGSTACSRNGRIKHFLIFLAGNGGTDASCITESSAHDHVPAKSSNHAKSVRAILTALRCFLRHLHLEGMTERDLSPSVPNPKPCYAPELPSTWTADEVSRLMNGIDRGNPTGKRDYAMLLMVARLGLRASDIKSMLISDVDWSARTISITQHKTGVAPGLPPPGDIGWAVIDYLREGRPKAATCPQLFVRQVAPFDAFGATANLTNILIRRARGAGIRAPRDHKTLHSLRHALAKRLPGQEVPTGDISRILGHVDRRTTGTCLRMDVDSPSACALDPAPVA